MQQHVGCGKQEEIQPIEQIPWRRQILRNTAEATGAYAAEDLENLEPCEPAREV